MHWERQYHILFLPIALFMGKEGITSGLFVLLSLKILTVLRLAEYEESFRQFQHPALTNPPYPGTSRARFGLGGLGSHGADDGEGAGEAGAAETGNERAGAMPQLMKPDIGRVARILPETHPNLWSAILGGRCSTVLLPLAGCDHLLTILFAGNVVHLQSLPLEDDFEDESENDAVSFRMSPGEFFEFLEDLQTEDPYYRSRVEKRKTEHHDMLCHNVQQWLEAS